MTSDVRASILVLRTKGNLRNFSSFLCGLYTVRCVCLLKLIDFFSLFSAFPFVENIRYFYLILCLKTKNFAIFRIIFLSCTACLNE